MTVGSYRYPVSRKDRVLFKSRGDYLEAQAGKRVSAPSFCHALEATIDPGRRDRRGVARSGWDEFPWLTLVLGSGCLDLADTSEITPDALAAAVQASLEHGFPKHAGESFATLASTFTRSLAEDRIQSIVGSPVRSRAFPHETESVTPTDDMEEAPDGALNAEPGMEIEPIAARLALIAALLTRLYYLSSGSAVKAMSRWDDDVAEVDPSKVQFLTANLMDTNVDPVLSQIAEVRKLLDRTDVAAAALVVKAVSFLLDKISTGLRGSSPDAIRRLRLDHLRLVTEVTWHFLVLRTPLYPGWTDLLLGLMLNEAVGKATSFRRARPLYFDLTELPTAVSALLIRATTESWKDREDVGRSPSSRTGFYRSAAQVLWSQAEAVGRTEEAARRRAKNLWDAQTGAQVDRATGPADAGSDSKLPPATAFVTSFDLELEMALWQNAGQLPFTVAVPVHLLVSQEHAEDPEAELCWLLGEIDPRPCESHEAELDLLRTPTKWRLLTPDSDVALFRSKPMVVHLSGCPLLRLPELNGTDDSATELITDLKGIGVSVDDAQLFHAVTVDEYLALRQAEAELFWSSSHATNPQARLSRALHPTLTNDGTKNRRFWMALAVPIGDSAVRHRVVSQITLRRLHAAVAGVDTPGIGSFGETGEVDPVTGLPLSRPTGGDERPPRPDVDGIAVNRRVNDDEASLLYWVGLDVVEDDCRMFTQDLLHYAAHVDEVTKLKRPPQAGNCPLSAVPSRP